MFIEELGRLLEIEQKPQFTVQQRETLYAAAYAFYQGNDFAKGADIFTLLVCYDPYDDRFWKGLASCCQMQKKYEEALRAWAVFCVISENRNEGFLHAAACFRSLGQLADAEKALKLGEVI